VLNHRHDDAEKHERNSRNPGNSKPGYHEDLKHQQHNSGYKDEHLRGAGQADDVMSPEEESEEHNAKNTEDAKSRDLEFNKEAQNSSAKKKNG